MNIEAIDHRPRQNYIYALDGQTVQIRLRAQKGDLDRCMLIYGDKFEPPERRVRLPMEVFAADERFDWWECTIEPPNRRLAYVFELTSGERTVWLNEKGIDPEPPNGTMALYFFEYPYLYAKDVFGAPRWVNETIFYQVFVERFANGDPANDPAETLPWDAAPDRQTFRGGDLRGIADRLDHIAGLGAGGLYLTPVFTSPSNHKYDIADYRSVDPHFGDIGDLRTLVDKCHSLGIRVILDIVINHCSSDFFAFRDVLEHGSSSAYKDWFIAAELPLRREPKPNYATFAFEPGMPKLNTEHPEVRAYMIDTIRYWMRETGIDGWRIDVANDVDQAFLRELRQTVKAENPDAFLLGEIWYDALPWLGGDQLDSVMNYNLAHPVKKFFAEGAWNARQFAEHVGQQLAAYPETVTNHLFNVMDSHDTERLLHTCRGDKRRMKLAVLFQFMYSGAPCIYYGNEFGMTGAYDPDSRRSMVWDETKQDRDMYDFYRFVIACRKKWPAWRNGKLSFLAADPESNALVYMKKDGADCFLVAVNNRESGAEIALPSFAGIDGEWEDIVTGERVRPIPAATARFDPFGFRIYRKLS